VRRLPRDGERATSAAKGIFVFGDSGVALLAVTLTSRQVERDGLRVLK
jgi:hypothetical protein